MAAGDNELPQGNSNPPRSRRTPRKQSFSERWRRMSLPNQLMFGATLVIAVATVVNVIVFTLESISSSHQTDKLVWYAQAQAESSDNFTDSAYWMEQHMDDAANAIQDSVDTADRNTKLTLRDSQTFFREEQRAWVGLGQYQIQAFDDKNPFKLLLPWTNSGKTPAIKTESAVSYALSPTPLDGPPPGYKYSFESASAIAPQGSYGLAVTNMLVPKRFDVINDGKVFLYFFGQFRYRDVYTPTVHTTSFCIFYSKLEKQMSFCKNGNEMD